MILLPFEERGVMVGVLKNTNTEQNQQKVRVYYHTLYEPFNERSI